MKLYSIAFLVWAVAFGLLALKGADDTACKKDESKCIKDGYIITKQAQEGLSG